MTKKETKVPVVDLDKGEVPVLNFFHSGRSDRNRRDHLLEQINKTARDIWKDESSLQSTRQLLRINEPQYPGYYGEEGPVATPTAKSNMRFFDQELIYKETNNFLLMQNSDASQNGAFSRYNDIAALITKLHDIERRLGNDAVLTDVGRECIISEFLVPDIKSAVLPTYGSTYFQSHYISPSVGLTAADIVLLRDIFSYLSDNRTLALRLPNFTTRQKDLYAMALEYASDKKEYKYVYLGNTIRHICQVEVLHRSLNDLLPYDVKEVFFNAGTYVFDDDLRKESTRLRKAACNYVASISGIAAVVEAIYDYCQAYRKMFDAKQGKVAQLVNFFNTAEIDIEKAIKERTEQMDQESENPPF